MIKRVIDKLEENRERRINGDVISIPWSLPRLSRVLPGIVQGRYSLVSANSKVGKCFAKDTPILMFDGTTKNVQDINNGDLLMGPDSISRIVSGKTNGTEQMYLISQDRGINYEVNESHILRLMNLKTNSEINISVLDYMKLSLLEKKRLVAVYSDPIIFPENNDVQFDPYFVGLWLGDGNSSDLVITNTDKSIINYIFRFAKRNNLRISKGCKNNPTDIRYFLSCPSIWEVKKFGRTWKFNSREDANSIIKSTHLEYIGKCCKNKKLLNGFEINLLRKKGEFFENFFSVFNRGEKSVPIQYKITSIDNRRKLLAGLIDTDGYTKNGVSYEICFKREELCDDINFIARSLGILTRKTKFQVNDSDYWELRLFGNQLSSVPMRLSRRICTPAKKNYFGYNRISIKKTDVSNYYGFTVNKDNLFLLKDFTVVHNTQIGDFLYMYQPIEWLYKNKYSGKKMKLFYFSLEMNKEKKLLAAISYKLFTDHGYIISPENLQSIFENYTIDQKIIDLIKSKSFIDWLKFVEECVEFNDSVRNPYGIFSIVKAYAESHGHYEYKHITIQDSITNEPVSKRVVDYYVADNPEEYVGVLVDHYSLMQPEKGETLRECIGRFSSEYALKMRDRFGYFVVGIQQQSADSEKQEFTKSGATIIERLKPSADYLADCRTTSRDVDLMIGLFAPARYNIKEYNSWDLARIGHQHRELLILLNRNGISSASIDLMFLGACNYFEELPREPSEKTYEQIRHYQQITI